MSPALHLPKRLARSLLDVLLPPQCLSCDQPVLEQGQLCATCFAGLTFVSHPFCPRCAVPAAHAGTLMGGSPRGLCAACSADPPPFQAARAALQYDDASRHLILQLKHADRVDLAKPLARLMHRAGADILAEADLLVPVPLHPKRLRARRYNQAALLARALSRLSGVPSCLDALVRVHATSPLAELSAEARAGMLAGAIAPRRGRAGRIAGQRVVLVDDVLTSGATAAACTRSLLAAGAAHVALLAAARVPDPRVA